MELNCPAMSSGAESVLRSSLQLLSFALRFSVATFCSETSVV